MTFTLIKPNLTPLPGYVRKPLQTVALALCMIMLWRVFIRHTSPLHGFVELTIPKELYCHKQPRDPDQFPHDVGGVPAGYHEGISPFDTSYIPLEAFFPVDAVRVFGLQSCYLPFPFLEINGSASLIKCEGEIPRRCC